MVSGLRKDLCMKYFIDFEYYHAPVFKISSVGCVDENGREFYSLVRQNDPEIDNEYCKSRMIRRIDFLMAPSLDEVFVKLFNWINHKESVEIYCYGSSDYVFVNSALKEKLTFEANCVLLFLKHNMIDYSAEVFDFFHTKINIGLIKIINYIRGYEVKQLHNALDDAKFLKEIYDYIQITEPLKGCPFGKYEIFYSMDTDSRIPLVAIGGKKRYCFESYLNAAKHFTEFCKPSVSEERYCEIVESTIERIKKAISKKTRFMGMLWKIDC